MQRQKQRGFTVVELLCVIAIIGILIGMLLPVAQNLRSTARDLACKNNMRQIVLAAASFEASHRRLPPGTLGFDGLLAIESEGGESQWHDPADSMYWQNAQHTSSLVLLLPYLELGPAYKGIPREVVSIGKTLADVRPVNEWIGLDSNYSAIIQQRMPIFECPSDDIANVQNTAAIALVTTQPSYRTSDLVDGFAMEQMLEVIRQPAPTSYVGCSGAHSGGRQPDPELTRYRGMMTCRERMTMSKVADGTSHTIMYGENVGGINDGNRVTYQSWSFGGLARGRGILPWGSDINESFPEHLLLGDHEYAFPVGFGSKHALTVNFGFGDGSVRAVSRRVSVAVFYAQCGAFDGQVIGELE